MRIPGWNAPFNDAEIAWVETESPGVSWYLIESLAAVSAGADEARRPGAAVLIRMAPGHGYPAHRHLGPEHVLVLRGGYRDERGEYTTGSFVQYPPGSIHSPIALGDTEQPVTDANPACVLFAIAERGIELVV